MSAHTEGMMVIVAAFIVMLSAMWEPLASAIVASSCLVALAVYRLVVARRS